MIFKLGEAFVELTVKDAGYLAGLSKAESALKGLARRVSGALSSGALSGLKGGNALLGQMSTQAGAAAASMKGLASSIRGVTSAATAMNAALGKKGGSVAPDLLKAQGQASAAMTRAQGAATAAQVRAQGSASAQMVKASHGPMIAQIRAQGQQTVAQIRAQAQLAQQQARMAAQRGSILGDLRQFAAELFTLQKAKQAFEYIRDTAIDMETQMYKLGRASGLAGDDLAKLGADFRRFAGTNAGVELEKVFELGTIGAKLGIQGPQLSLFTRDLAKMSAVLEDIPADEAATRIARLTSIFGRGNDEAIRFASALNKLDLMSAATARDILDVTTRFAPQAAFFKMPPSQAMALATATRQAGTPIETAGTSLSQIFTKMASRKEMGQFARVAGEPIERFKKTLQTMPLKAIEQVAMGIRRIAESDKENGILKADRALDRIGLDGQRTRITLLGLSTVLPQLSEYTKAASEDWYSLDSIMKSFGQQGETAKAKLILMWNNVQILANKIGVALLPMIKGFAEGVVGLTRDIGKWADRNKELFEGWGRNIGGFFRDLGALPRTWKLQLELLLLIGQQKMQDLVALFMNSKAPLAEVFTYLGDTVTAVFGTSLSKGGRKAGLDFVQGYTETVISALEKLPGGGMIIQKIFGADAKTVRTVLRAVVDAQKNAIDREKAQLPKAPAFEMGNLDAKIKAKQAEIKAQRDAQDKERAAEKAADDDEDARTRRRAMNMRQHGQMFKQIRDQMAAQEQADRMRTASGRAAEANRLERLERDAFNRMMGFGGRRRAPERARLPEAQRVEQMRAQREAMGPADERGAEANRAARERGDEFQRMLDARAKARLEGAAPGADLGVQRKAALEQGERFQAEIERRNEARRKAAGLAPGGGNLAPEAPKAAVGDQAAKKIDTTNEKLDKVVAAIENINMGWA